jgi:chromosome partitioning protein
VIRIRGRDDLHKIVVLNPKGGCGKTTLSTNLASAFAIRGTPPTLIDCDPQGYCTNWVEKRSSELPEVYGIQCYDESTPASMTIDIDVPPDSDTVIVDMPAAIPHDRLYDYTFFADSLLIPIQASEIDVYSATRFIAELLIDAQLDRREARLGIVANRVRARTKSYERLMRFLTSLKIPMIAQLRDSQNFVHAAAAGVGIAEMPAYRVRDDLPQVERIVNWLDRRRAETQRDLADVVTIPTLAMTATTGHSAKGNEASSDHLEDKQVASSRFEREGN